MPLPSIGVTDVACEVCGGAYGTTQPGRIPSGAPLAETRSPTEIPCVTTPPPRPAQYPGAPRPPAPAPASDPPDPAAAPQPGAPAASPAPPEWPTPLPPTGGSVFPPSTIAHTWASPPPAAPSPGYSVPRAPFTAGPGRGGLGVRVRVGGIAAGIIMMLISGFLLAAFGLVFLTTPTVEHPVAAVATVVDVKTSTSRNSNGSRSTSCTPVVEFTTADGVLVQTTPSAGSSTTCGYQVGQQVAIQYDADNPRVISGIGDTAAMIGKIIGLGLPTILFLLGTAQVVLGTRTWLRNGRGDHDGTVHPFGTHA